MSVRYVVPVVLRTGIIHLWPIPLLSKTNPWRVVSSSCFPPPLRAVKWPEWFFSHSSGLWSHLAQSFSRIGLHEYRSRLLVERMALTSLVIWISRTAPLWQMCLRAFSNVDALASAQCEKTFRDVMSGTKKELYAKKEMTVPDIMKLTGFKSKDTFYKYVVNRAEE